MIAAQATRARRLALADDVLANTGTLADLAGHVAALDRVYRTLAAA
jgi:dephospho-CoA kinase